MKNNINILGRVGLTIHWIDWLLQSILFMTGIGLVLLFSWHKLAELLIVLTGWQLLSGIINTLLIPANSYLQQKLNRYWKLLIGLLLLFLLSLFLTSQLNNSPAFSSGLTILMEVFFSTLALYYRNIAYTLWRDLRFHSDFQNLVRKQYF